MVTTAAGERIAATAVPAQQLFFFKWQLLRSSTCKFKFIIGTLAFINMLSWRNKSNSEVTAGGVREGQRRRRRRLCV